MKKYYLAYLLFSFVISFSQKIKSQSDYCFYENKGQIIDQNGKSNSGVKYLFNSAGLNVQLKKGGFSYDVYEVEKTKKKISKTEKTSLQPNLQNKITDFDYKYKFHRVDIELLNSNKNAEIIAEGKSNDYDNYYNIPNKPEGVTNIYRYQKIIYKNIYPNIDLAFFKPKDSTKTVEYNFIINPGAKISDIKLKFKGAKTKLKDGKLSMNLRFGEMQENIPHSWTEETNSKSDISVKFKEIETGVFGFEAPQDSYDKMVVIDPVPTRIWGSYNNDNSGYGEENFIISSNNPNFVYESSQCGNSKNIATSGTFMTITVLGMQYGYVIKFDNKGNKVWGTFIGNHNDIYIDETDRNKIWDGIVDSQDNIYIVGSVWNKYTTSNSITTTGTFNPSGTLNNREAFILKLNPLGQRIWGTYFGGDEQDEIFCIDLDSNENLVFGGSTLSKNNITTPDAEIPNFSNGIWDVGFWGKIKSDGKQLIYSSYFYAPIKVIHNDNLDNIFIGGQYLKSLNLPKFTTVGAHQENLLGAENAFIVKFNNAFKKQWGTFYGGGNFQNSTSYRKYNELIKLGSDYDNNLYIVGNTSALDHISTIGAQKEATNGFACDIFLAKLDSNGNRKWGTYYGSESSYDDFINDAKIINNGEIYFAGRTWNTDGIIPPLNQNINLAGGFITKFKNDGFIDYSFLYNNPHIWAVSEIKKIDVKNDNIYVSGVGDHPTYFATLGAYQLSSPWCCYGGKFIAKFGVCSSNPFAISNSPICPNTNINLQASGGTSYSWTGPNGFTSSLQNPTITNATSVNSGIYNCTITGTGGCDGTFNVDVKVEDKTPPTPNVATLPNINGDCHTLVTTIPTATDNCSGKITATTTNPLQYSIPGNYTITWNYNDGNGNITTQNQNVTITSPALPVANSPQVFCAINNPKISDISITAQNPIWYDALGTVINSSTPLIDGNTYYVTQTINGCESNKLPIAVTVHNTPLPTGNQNQDFCSSRNALIKDLAVTGKSLKFYDNLGNVLNQNTVLQNNTSYYVTQTLNNCESAKFEIKVTLTANSLPANNYNLAFCNDTTDNTKTEDLRNYQENIITGSSTYSFDYFDQNNNQIFDFANRSLQLGFNTFNVKVKSSDGCWKMVQLILQLNPKPVVNLPADKEICNGVSIELNAGSGFKHYDWTKDDNPTVFSNDEKISVTSVGKYTVEVTNNSNCKNSSSTIVTQAILAQILKVEIINNNIKVLLSASGNFEYSLDNINWQSSNEFSNLSNGNYTVYVKTKLGCIIGNMNFSIFSIPNAFTPNNDGINDTWKIDGLEVYPNSEITVFDKYGTKVFYTKTNGTFEWDGTLNQRKLPTGTYWYILKISDGRLFQGFLFIKNRN